MAVYVICKEMEAQRDKVTSPIYNNGANVFFLSFF